MMKNVVETMDIKTDGKNIAIIFPRWFFIAGALLLMSGVGVNALSIYTLRQLQVEDRGTIKNIARTVARLEKDSIRTRLIIEEEFPETSQRVDRALRQEDDS